MSDRLKLALFLFLGFFALYALTAQRGLGWGDSGEFQHWVLSCSQTLCGKSYSNSHPLYVLFARVFSSTPLHVTLVSSFFGALSVGGFLLCTGNLRISVLFGLSQMLWMLSCIAEVQTMNLAFTVFGTFLFLRYLETGAARWFVSACFLAGLQLEVHNFALLALPVYAIAAIKRRLSPVAAAISVLAWAAGGSYFLAMMFLRSPADVLVGTYGGQVAGLLPANAVLAAFNLALAALSFAVPLFLMWKCECRPCGFVGALFAVNFVFFARYFVPDQATFLLPTLFFAYLAIGRVEIASTRFFALVAMQIVLPAMAWALLSSLPVPEWRKHHKYRDDAAYFALPWKFTDRSADRLAAELGGEWDGYPENDGSKEGK